MSSSSDQAVVIWGELLWDRFPDGDLLGGAPANVAWHLGLAGGWAQLITRVGDDPDGQRAIERIEEVCDTSLIQIDRELATGEVKVVIEAGEPRYTLVPDRAWQRIECTPEARRAIGEAGVLAFGSLAQRTAEGLAGWREAIAAAGRSCLKVCDVNLRKTDGVTSGDPAERGAVREALDAADVIKVNDRELEVLTNWYGTPALPRLRDRARVVAVTHGADGSTLYGERELHVPAVRARAGGDNVGCGDAYLALLIHGMTLGWDLEASAHVASRWAAAVAGVRGATPHFEDAVVAQLLGEAAA